MSPATAARPMGPIFTTDWFQTNCGGWTGLFDALGWDATQPHTVIEIGSFEGASACWILHHLLTCPASRIYCIDTFLGSPDHTLAQREGLSHRFLANIETTGRSDQTVICHGDSREMLIGLAQRGVTADFVYVDGSHVAIDVLTDAVLGWHLLKRGGVMILDDYMWSGGLGPKIAIDALMSCLGPLSDESWYHRTAAQMCLFKV